MHRPSRRCLPRFPLRFAYRRTIAACRAGTTGCNKAWVKSARKRNRATACKKVAGRAGRGRKVRGLAKAADKGLARSQERAKAGQVVRVAGDRPVLEVRADREVKVVKVGRVDRDKAEDQADKVDQAVPVAVGGKGPAAAALARAEVVAALVVVVGKNKSDP